MVDDYMMINVQDISERKEAELNLKRRLAKESLIVTISSRLLTLKTHQVNAYIEIALKEVSQHINAEWATVFHYSDDNQRGDCTHEWCAPGIDSQKSSLQNIPLSSFPGIYQNLNEGQFFQANIDTIQDEAVQEKGSFSTSATYSVMAIPLIQEEKTNGFIAFYSISKPKQWDQNDILFLESFCTLIANCIDKVKKEQEISRANFRLEGLREIDQALLSSRLSDRPPLFIALKYIYFMVPSERVTVFIIDEATNMAVAKCRMINGEINLQPDFSIPASYFHEQFRHNKPSVYYENVQHRSAGLNELIPNYEETYQSVLIVPLLFKGICIGAFTLGATTAYFFTEEYQQIAEELAYQIAIILYQQQLDEQLKIYTDQLEQRVIERTREVNELSTLHQAILKHAGQAIISTDIYGVVQTANQACENLLGFTAEELIGRFIRIEPGPPTDPVPYISYLTDLRSETTSNSLLDGLAAQGYLYGEYKAVDKNGNPIPVLLATSILADENEVTIGYVGIITDISALKIAEARLQHKNKELNAIFDGAIDLHCLIDNQGKLVKVNQAWEITLGYSAQELETLSFWQLARADEQIIISDNLQLVKTNKSLRNQSNQFQKKDGNDLVLEWNAVGIEDQIYVSARDITIRQQSEVQLRSLNQRLQLATQATGQGIWENDFIKNQLFWDNRIWLCMGLIFSRRTGHTRIF
jgi:PAS domain S-box-containing protein